MRFDGSDTALMIPAPADGSDDFEGEFKKAYKAEFGFLLEKGIVVDDVKVRNPTVQCFVHHRPARALPC
jgi:5-oxoprolinase (ATP-hydrolysing)